MNEGKIFLLLLEKSSLIIVLFIMITKIKGFKYIFQKEKYKAKDLIVISIIFSLLAILGTYNGISVHGSLANTRIIAIVSGGVLFGPLVGIVSGVVSGTHRYITDINGITSLPCFISSIFAGIISGYFYNKISDRYRWIYGILCGVASESFTMLLIYLLSKPHIVAVNIIQKIYIPMIVGQIGIGFLVSIVQAIKKEKDELAAFQSKLALDIANKTLPYFRSVNEESLRVICSIIKEEINSDSVAITDTNKILAYVGIGEEVFNNSDELSEITKQSMNENKILNIKVEKEGLSLSEKINLKTVMIIPLTESQNVIGSLKIYYTEKYDMSHSKKTLAIGLSQMISTLMEVSKIEKMKEAKNKAEIKALQTQINPHFLFNALNTITSFIRIDPDKARKLIINLSTYMRYNLEVSDNLIEIQKELEQVKAYVEIEKARFGDKLNVLYDIEENINKKIPSLIIQPLVENAIIHGIRQNGGYGTVVIGVKSDNNNKTKIWVENDGITIDEEIIKKVYNDNMPENKIGLYNVHLRLKLIYGKGVKIKRLNPGTKIEFEI